MKDTYLRALSRSYYDVVDQRIRSGNRLRWLPPAQAAFLQEHVIDQCVAVEAALMREMKRELEQCPIWTEFLVKVKGIGVCLAARILGEIDISITDTISKLWAYGGQSVGYVIVECTGKSKHKLVATSFPDYPCPVPKKGNPEKRCGAEFRLVSEHPGEAVRRHTGCRCGWNTHLQAGLWNLGKSFVKVGGVYRRLYEQVKEDYRRRDPDCDKKGHKGHIDAMARRKTVKIFLAGLWVRWRELEGLPVSKPYVLEHLGHTDYIEPMTDE